MTALTVEAIKEELKNRINFHTKGGPLSSMSEDCWGKAHFKDLLKWIEEQEKQDD